jgi:hypothetical protein
MPFQYHPLTQAPAIARKFDETEHITADDGIDWEALRVVYRRARQVDDLTG